MLKAHHPISPASIALIGVAVILVVALGAVAYLRMAPPALPVPAPVANPVVVNPIQIPVTGNLVAPRSVYMSEQSLRRWLDDAYEKHQGARVQMLLDILNKRYEHRCCGLPR